MRILLMLILLCSCDGFFRVPTATTDQSCATLFREFFQYKTGSKSFNEIFLGFTPKRGLKRTFGIEDEFLIPDDMGRKGVADFLEEELKKAYPGLEIKRHYQAEKIEAYETYQKVYDTHTVSYVINGERKSWKITPEEIWSLPIDTEICEIASPIMRTKKEQQFYTSFIKKLSQERGAKAYTKAGGVHYHYGVEDLQENELKLLFFAYRKVNSDLSLFFNKSDIRQHVADLSSKDHILSKYFSDATSNIFDEDLVVQQKKTILRFDPDLKTIELRIVNSSMEPKIIDAGLEFHSKLVDAIRVQKPELMDYLAKCFRENRDATLLELEPILNLTFLPDSSLSHALANGM